MVWPIMIIATLASILVAVICAAFGIRTLSLVLPAQIAISFLAAYGVSVGFRVDPDDQFMVWSCLAAAVAVPATWAMMAAIVGPLRRRRSAHREARSSP
jgi:hypothetical protein